MAYADGSAVESTEIANGTTIIVNAKGWTKEQTKDLSYHRTACSERRVKDTLTEELSSAGTAAGYAGKEMKRLKQTGNTEGYVKSGVAYADGSAVEGTEI